MKREILLKGNIILEISEKPKIPKNLEEEYPGFNLEELHQNLLSLPPEEILPILSFPIDSIRGDHFFKTEDGYLVYIPICVPEIVDFSLSVLEKERDRPHYNLFTKRLEEDFEFFLTKRLRTLLTNVKQTMPPNCDISIETLKKLSEYQIINLVAVFAISHSPKTLIRICENEESSRKAYIVEKVYLDRNGISIERKNMTDDLKELVQSHKNQKFDIVAVIEIKDPIKSLMENGYLQDNIVLSIPSSLDWERYVDSHISIKRDGEYILGGDPRYEFEFDGVLIDKNHKKMTIIENKRRIIKSDQGKTSTDRNDFLKFLGKIYLVSQYLPIPITSIFFTGGDLSDSEIKKYQETSQIYVIDRNDWRKLFSVIRGM